MICRIKWKARIVPRKGNLIPSVAQLPFDAAEEFSPAEPLHAALRNSSIGVAVCDHDFTVRLFNPRIARLIGGTARPGGVLNGMTILGMLGIDETAAMADIVSRGGWSGTRALGDTETRAEMHVVVEAFHDTNSDAGWLITVHAHAERAAPAPLSDHQLITLSSKLTAREREVMLALQEGASNKAIAQRLDISPRTVEFHRARIMRRFGAKSVVDLVRRVTRDVQATM